MMNVASFLRSHNLNSKQRKDCILINEVKRYTFLYDRNEMNHKRSRYRQAAWDEIGRKLGMDGIDCMNRWKIIRDRYRREKRTKSSGPRSVRAKRWLYYDLCTFLDPYLEDVKSYTQELDELMNEECYSAEDSSQDFDQMEYRPKERGSSADDPSQSSTFSSSSTTNVQSLPPESSATFSVAQLHSSSSTLLPASTFIRIVVPENDPQTVNSKQSSAKKIPARAPPRKYVRILPKLETSPQKKSPGNKMKVDDDDSIDLSLYKEKQELDTVDHLMTFMGNTLKQLPFNRQVKICQELTAVFFNIITNEEAEEDSS